MYEPSSQYRRCAVHRSGFTIIELAILLAIVALLVAIVLPTAGRLRSASMNDVSHANLAIMNVGHILYAGDWNDRQVTWVVDDLATYGNNATQALTNYVNQHGEHPGLALGWCDGGLWGYWIQGPVPVNTCVVIPINFFPPCTSWGSFRLPNAYAFHSYIGGRFYEPTFYAPDDEVPYEVVSPLFDEPCEFYNVDGNIIYWSSYALSPAAMFDPGVMRPANEGGWQNPFSYGEGLASPPVSVCKFPTLKTRMIEHHWTDEPPASCNPAFAGGTYDDCEPYYFNHGFDAAPLTLFFDGSIRALPNSEVQAWDEFLLARNGDGLWNRTTPLGDQGYYNDVAYDTFVDVSHHILTNDGILGRDTLGPDAPPLAPPPRNDRGGLFSTGQSSRSR